MNKGKIVANSVVILIVAVTVFFIGWIPFNVKEGNCAVMVSKTGGVYEKPIIPGKFIWRWERLLPTNVTIRLFSISPFESKQTVAGSLPSADIFSKQLKDEPDFSYKVDLSVTLHVTPEEMVALVKKYDFSKQEQLASFLQSRAEIAAKKVTEYFLENKESDLSFSTNAVTAQELQAIVTKSGDDFSLVTVDSVSVKSAKIPDFSLYKLAKTSYEEYQKEVTESLKKAAADQAASVVDENRSIERLEKLGQLLQKYPQLQEIFKNGDATSIMNAIKLFH